jgi:phosphoserine aminotransferase
VLTELCSVYIAGQVLKKLLRTFPNKVDGQEALSAKKAELIYGALEAHPEAYKIVPEKSVRSRMNICFRVTKVSHPLNRGAMDVRICTNSNGRTARLTSLRRVS